jgi:antitoxin (DNA-binding transcriptional repressor) of toxin-antitoxin stability system
MKIVTLNQLHENTSGVIQELRTSQEPFVLTRRGRLLALVQPLPDGVEGVLAAEWLKENNL